MRTLCIDTSGPAALALVEDGKTLAQARESNPRKHAESLGVLLQQVAAELPGPPSVRELGIDRICVGTGPGPFTGLRAGIAFAMTLGRGLDVPVLGIGSQEALARGALDQIDAPQVVVVTDAKRRELYWGIYRPGGMDEVVQVAGPNVGAPLDAIEAVSGTDAVVAAGPAAAVEALQAMATKPLKTVALELDPAVLARLADARPGGEFPLEPLYLRRPDIHGQPTQLLG